MTPDPAASFAVLLRRYRVAAGLSQEALGERAGLSTRAISDLERGARRVPYRETVRMLADALDLPATDRDALEAAVERGRRPRPDSSASEGVTPPALPVPATPLIGREQAIADVRALLLRPDLRLLTLTGAPGIGKTRLALAVAADLADDLPGGVVFTSLAPLADPRLVATAILQALGLADVGGRPAAERLTDVLREREALLILDNFEQIVEAAPLVGTLLEDCPRLTVLVTSRVPLHLGSEFEYPVHPLALPERSPNSSGADMMARASASPAIALFLERARAVQPGFAITPGNAPDLIEICHHLDGLPLAIVLAAARSKVLSPQAIRRRLSRRFDFLTGGVRDAPGRHRTLREAIAWSHDLLTPQEQVLFRRLGVFVGGGTLEAIASVCEPDLDVFEGVNALVDKSLVQQREDADGEPRFWMLETLREYAGEQLDVTGELPRLHAALAGYMVNLAEAAEPHLFTGDRAAWLQHLTEEQENIRAVLAWSLQQEDPEAGLRLVGSLWLWFLRRLLVEGRQWAERLLDHPGANQPLATRAGALFTAGHFAWLQGDMPVMRARMEEVVNIRRAQGDAAGLGRALPFLGLAIDDDYPAARRLAEEGVALSREAGTGWDLALALINLGRIAATAGNDHDARAPLEEATALCRTRGDTWLHGLALNSLGAIAWREGRYSDAHDAFAWALDSFRQVEDRRNTTQAMTNLGFTVLARGEVEQARLAFVESLAFGREHGDRFNAVACLRGFGAVALAAGDPERAIPFFALADTMFTATGATHWPAERLGGPVATGNLRARLGDGTFAAAWAIGQVWSLEAATAEAVTGWATASTPEP